MTTLAAHPPHCHACGYDTSSIPADATRCPECGVELSAWRSRWHTRLTLHALSLLVFAPAACAVVWMLNHAVRSWLSAGGVQMSDNLSTVRPTEALIFLPAILALAGIALLASVCDHGSARRNFAFTISSIAAVVFCVMLAQRALSGSSSYDGPVWMRLVSIRNAGWWACAAMIPLCAGAVLSLLSGIARSAGLGLIAAWCARAVFWLPILAILAIVACELYEYLAQVSLTAAAQVQTGRGALPGIPVRGSNVFPMPPTYVSPPWYLTTGVQFARLLLYTFLIASSTAVWLAACITRLRLRDATDPNR